MEMLEWDAHTYDALPLPHEHRVLSVASVDDDGVTVGDDGLG